MQQANSSEVNPLVVEELKTSGDMPRGLTLATMMIIGCSLVLSVIGQALLKYGMGQMGALIISLETLPQIILQIATSPFVLGGLFVYAVATFFWLVTLSRVDLSVAYPSLSLTQVLVLGVAWLILREEISPLRVAGVLVICLGMLLVARS
ncbi:multidrug resistance protein [Candidatus Viridilinea mediisalina]|uniref:Multidrug resistance protein n=1 Tax=Candidatus Viridilinea mediisalina TaxID=2024553 RepID=A0A2A6RPB2_9CHLR|nr:multidrug resistance protein [Candidatus Viridilinea mediisalina]PDW04765.1 multidrug resistance protein [Candidatus Viridilinea mediisalina]